MTKLMVCLMLGAMTSQAGTVYDLTQDFSTTQNPNGVWSFVQGTTPLAEYAQPTDGNTLNPAAANGYFGTAPNFYTAPFVLQTSEDGSATGAYTNNDFLAGDVLVHSTNPGTGSPVFIDWTAPTAGTITFSGEVWYAHSPVNRSNDFYVTLDGGSALASRTVTNGDGLNNASSFSDSNILTVQAGDILALELTPSASQQFGSLAGVDLTVNFTTPTSPSGTPEPGTIWLLAGSLPAIALFVKRRRSASRT